MIAVYPYTEIKHLAGRVGTKVKWVVDRELVHGEIVGYTFLRGRGFFFLVIADGAVNITPEKKKPDRLYHEELSIEKAEIK